MTNSSADLGNVPEIRFPMPVEDPYAQISPTAYDDWLAEVSAPPPISAQAVPRIFSNLPTPIPESPSEVLHQARVKLLQEKALDIPHHSRRFLSRLIRTHNRNGVAIPKLRLHKREVRDPLTELEATLSSSSINPLGEVKSLTFLNFFQGYQTAHPEIVTLLDHDTTSNLRKFWAAVVPAYAKYQLTIQGSAAYSYSPGGKLMHKRPSRFKKFHTAQFQFKRLLDRKRGPKSPIGKKWKAFIGGLGEGAKLPPSMVNRYRAMREVEYDIREKMKELKRGEKREGGEKGMEVEGEERKRQWRRIGRGSRA